MCLSSEAARGTEASCVDKARTLGGKAEVLLAQVQLAHIVVALAAVLVGCAIARGPRGMVGLQCKFGGDLLQRILGVWEAELVAEKGGFRGSAIGVDWGSDVIERGLDVLLGFLHQAGDVEHGFGLRTCQSERNTKQE